MATTENTVMLSSQLNFMIFSKKNYQRSQGKWNFLMSHEVSIYQLGVATRRVSHVPIGSMRML